MIKTQTLAVPGGADESHVEQGVDVVRLEVSCTSSCHPKVPHLYASAVMWFRQAQMMCITYRVTNPAWFVAK